MLGGACERGYIDYLSSCTSSTPCFFFCPGLTQPVFFLLCSFNSTARCHVRFYRYAVSLSGSSVVCGVLRGSPREHDCAISTTPEASLRKLSYQLPLRFNMAVHVRLSVFSNFSQATIVIQRIRNLRYDVRIHTDTACVQHVNLNVELAQARLKY